MITAAFITAAIQAVALKLLSALTNALGEALPHLAPGFLGVRSHS